MRSCRCATRPSSAAVVGPSRGVLRLALPPQAGGVAGLGQGRPAGADQHPALVAGEAATWVVDMDHSRSEVTEMFGGELWLAGARRTGGDADAAGRAEEIMRRPALARGYDMRSWTETWRPSSCAAASAGVEQYVASAGGGSRVAFAAATRASIRAACGPYVLNIVAELRTEFLTLTSFENSTVPPSTA